MKTAYLAFMAFFGGMPIQSYSQGYIVPNGVVDVSQPPSLITRINVIQNLSNSHYTAFSFIPEGANTFSFGIQLDVGVRVFLLSENDPVSLQTIQSQSYTELIPPNNYVFSQGLPFYLGLYTGSNPFDSNGDYTGIYSDPVFGWAKLENIGGSLQFLGGEAEFGGGGIYAGTQTIIPIPEPTVLGLLVLGTVGLTAFQRRKTSGSQDIA